MIRGLVNFNATRGRNGGILVEFTTQNTQVVVPRQHYLYFRRLIFAFLLAFQTGFKNSISTNAVDLLSDFFNEVAGTSPIIRLTYANGYKFVLRVMSAEY